MISALLDHLSSDISSAKRVDIIAASLQTLGRAVLSTFSRC